MSLREPSPSQVWRWFSTALRSDQERHAPVPRRATEAMSLHKLIVEQQVTNQVLDMGLLTETAEPAKEILGVATIDVVADKGYFKIEDIEACEKAGMQPYVPRPQRGPSVRKGLFRKDEFKYDPETVASPVPRAND